MNKYIAIMAGGVGSRLIPLSTQQNPKQFIKLFKDSDKTLFDMAYDRAKKVTDNCVISTHFDNNQFLENHISECIWEYQSKNTVGSLLFVLNDLLNKCDECLVAFIPSDHYIKDDDKFVEDLNKAFEIADKTNNIVTLGIKPHYPATCYGYLKPVLASEGYTYISFEEKPTYENAVKYVGEGCWWNSGIFVAALSTWVSELNKHCKDLYQLLIDQVTYSGYEINKRIPNISMDYALMNKSQNIVMVPANFDWNDLGSWQSLKELDDANINLSDEVYKYLDRIKIKPWGYEELWTYNYKYAGKMLYINKGQSLSLQYHEHKTESVYMLKGKMKLSLNNSEKIIIKGDSEHIPHNTKHRMEAIEDCIVLECSTPELDDVVRLEDKYGRVK